jgi:RNA polymerase sigma-70 factor (ECF subfamily)
MATSDAATGLLLSHRRALFAYIYAIVRDYHTAEDVLQDVSVVLIRRWEEFGQIGDFWKLAREVARRQSLSALRRARRAPLLLSEQALDALDRGFDQMMDQADDRAVALARCIEKLPDRWREVIRYRYWDKLPVGEIAQRFASTAGSISVTLNRIRSKLADCVTRSLDVEAAQ